jgi:hypothetical protein
MSEFNPFKVAQIQLDEAMTVLGLDLSTREFLRNPMTELTVSIPVRMDDGKVKTFRGYRVQYNTARGPAKGGLRWHPEETLDTVRALSAWMTWKTSLLDLPLGGGKGGVTCNPKELSENEKERLARAYIRKAFPILGDHKDIPAPDVYTTPQIMAWMMDEFETLRGAHEPGFITGKPLALGGSQGRSDATARGGIYTVREAAKHLQLDLSKSTYAVQGFGNAGQNAATLHKKILGGGRLLRAKGRLVDAGLAAGDDALQRRQDPYHGAWEHRGTKRRRHLRALEAEEEGDVVAHGVDEDASGVDGPGEEARAVPKGAGDPVAAAAAGPDVDRALERTVLGGDGDLPEPKAVGASLPRLVGGSHRDVGGVGAGTGYVVDVAGRTGGLGHLRLP